MPGKNAGGGPPGAARPCNKCGTPETTIVVRTHAYCQDCFISYIHTKAVKRMASYAYHVRMPAVDEARKLLLPVSFGVSSITLLHILDQHLQRQTSKTGRTWYSLHILFVDTSAVERDTPDAGRIEQLKERFPRHEYSSVSLAEIFEGVGAKEALQEVPEAASMVAENGPGTPQEKLERLLISLGSASSRADVTSILKTRLIVRFAQQNSCKDILWGDSTTKIAEKTLAETAKGRGFSLPWQVNDGMSPFGVGFNYPLQDLLKKELVTHAELASPPLTSLIHAQKPTQASASAKNTTIDDLMKQYFESVEQDYPSIVANVVRTSSKLEPASTAGDRCQLCNMPVAESRFGIHGWGGDQGGDAPAGTVHSRLCYGCTRSAPHAAGLLP